jgi:cation transport ATPase
MIVADGTIISGNSMNDQSSLTGELVPVSVTVGAIVPGESINCGTGHL